MIITCPNCGARFRLAEDALGAEGRRLRCSRCKHSWHERPAGAKTASKVVLEPPEPERDLLSEQLGDTEASRKAAIRAAQQDLQPKRPLESQPNRNQTSERLNLEPPKTSRTAPLIVGWIFFLVVVGAVLAGGWYFRGAIVAAVPEVGRFYALLGIEVVPDRAKGLELQGLAFREEAIEGDPTLIVTGRLENTSNSTLPVPMLLARVSDPSGGEILQWRFRIDALSLPPGGSEAFEARHPYPNHSGPIEVEVSLQRPQS